MSEGFKKCPFCNRVIMQDATVCKHCGESLVGGGNGAAGTGSGSNYVSSGNDDFGFFDGLTYMFTDKNLFLKWAGLAIVCMLMVMPYISMIGGMIIKADASTAQQLQQVKNSFINMLIMLLPAGIMYGYMINCVRSITTSSGTYNLPSIKFFDDFWTGAKFYLAMMLFMFPVGLVVAILGGIILVFMKPLLIFVPLFQIVFSLLIMVCAPAFMWMFAQRRYWSTFYKWGLVKNLIGADYNRYVKALLSMFLCGLVMWIPIGIIFAILILGLKANLFILSIAYSLFAAYGMLFGAFYIAKAISADKIEYLP